MKREYWTLVPIYGIVCMAILVVTSFISRTATVMAEFKPLDDRHCIIIDAGHGGIDGGATSCTGLLESQFNLQIALRLDDLMHLCGYDTRMIRTTDTSIHTSGDTIAARKISDLRERVRIVNETPNAILVSIHQNTFSDSRYSGAQVFYGATELSRELAQELQTLFSQTINVGSNRKSKTANGVYLMNNIEKTGILVECGFLSNPQEEAKLRDAEYQKKLCSVIVAAVSNFVNES